ncbi:MAG: HAD family phosphatase [bacterium]|nr:HAD family phosphatase [Parabacteroides distasonis]MCI6875636.1 HAD family phosphatase [Parabacteroides sp.]MDD6101328.1 HAD family phosphatase [bacterium]MDD6748530.1 HAD family phosphatase [bacterium]MDD6765511.1 HAD family phosphatase [bacterium]
MEQKKRVALFDFDGVIADTEPLYDLFWNDAAQRYGLPYENFAQRIKGTTMPLILATYFQQHTPAQIDQLFAEIAAFERDMSFPEIPGSIAFLQALKRAGVPMGLVTSSDDSKMAHAFRALPIRDLFDTLVTADRITNGKPDPMCYLLAAEDLQVNPADCIVFEDSFAGIEAATRAGMTIVGISSTNPAEALRPLVDRVIPNFNGLRPEELFV